jgi:hypothetical protein
MSNPNPKPRRRKVPRQTAAPTTPVNDDAPIWGAKNIAVVLGLSERQAFHVLESRTLKGCKRIGGKWSARSRRVLLENWEET